MIKNIINIQIQGALDVSDKQIPQLYKQLCELNIAGIINFNVDKLAINSFSEVKSSH